MITRLHLANGHAPRLRGSALEHRPGGCASDAHRLVEVLDRARPVGVLRAVLLVADGLDDPYARPVGIQFVGHHERQRGADTGAHLGAVRHDLHQPVGQDGEVDARRPWPLCTRVLREDADGHETRAEHEGTRSRGASQEGATRQHGRAHPCLPADCASLMAARIRWYVPQRHRMGSMKLSICASVAFGRVASSAAACMIWPLWQ